MVSTKIEEIMTRKNTPDARKRILQASIKVFAAKSFAGARVDEIAKEANTPKSLIYYHFKSKATILEVLTNDFLGEYKNIIQNAATDSHQSKFRDMQQGKKTSYTDFIKKNRDLMRIILIESLIQADSTPLIFKVVEEMINMEAASFKIGKQKNYNRAERLVAEFFTNIIPSAAYLCFREAWSSYFKIQEKKLDNLFGKILLETHGAYHKNHD